MKIYDYIMQQFDRTALTYKQIACGSKVPERTVQKIARKEINDPGVKSAQKIYDFFKKGQP
jgi:hypothetical protein